MAIVAVGGCGSVGGGAKKGEEKKVDGLESFLNVRGHRESSLTGYADFF